MAMACATGILGIRLLFWSSLETEKGHTNVTDAVTACSENNVQLKKQTKNAKNQHKQYVLH